MLPGGKAGNATAICLSKQKPIVPTTLEAGKVQTEPQAPSGKPTTSSLPPLLVGKAERQHRADKLACTRPSSQRLTTHHPYRLGIAKPGPTFSQKHIRAHSALL